MKETYEYNIKDQENETFNMKCKIEYDTKNEYDTNYYFYDGERWLKDFIDLNKLSPENKEDKNKFEDFITRVHDYMVHGTIWKELRVIDDGETLDKEQYKLRITSKKV